MQERRNSSALAMELRLSCINPSILYLTHWMVAWGIFFITGFGKIVAWSEPSHHPNHDNHDKWDTDTKEHI